MYESMMCSKTYEQSYSFYGDTEFGLDSDNFYSNISEYRKEERLDWEGGRTLWERIWAWYDDERGCSARRIISMNDDVVYSLGSGPDGIAALVQVGSF